jgi:hypothetical protein
MGDAQTVPLAEELETVPVRVLHSSGEVAYAASMPKTSTIKDRVAGRVTPVPPFREANIGDFMDYRKVMTNHGASVWGGSPT